MWGREGRRERTEGFEGVMGEGIFVSEAVAIGW